MKQASISIADLRAVVQTLPDNGLTPSREAALAHLDEHGLPTLRDESDDAHDDGRYEMIIPGIWRRQFGAERAYR